MSRPQITIVGAGIIGLAVAYFLVKAGARVLIVDRNPDGDKASFGNAGGIAVTEVVPASAPGVMWRVFGWMLDPLGPLAVRPSHAPKLIPWLVRFAQASRQREVEKISRALSALNARTYDDLVPMLRDAGLLQELHRHGALSVYESTSGYQRDAAEWACKAAHGIAIEELSGEEARKREPALGPLVRHAVFTPQWSHVSDPKRIVMGIQRWLQNQGVEFKTGDVRGIRPGPGASLSMEVDSETLSAECVVVAAGAWSAQLARSLGERALLESERGYNMTLPSPGIAIQHELVFAERKFVATPLSCGLRIGGAAEFGGLDAAPNYKRASVLVTLAQRYLPDLRTEGGTSWAGHRPATPDSLPVIGRSGRHPNVFYAFGHGHLGLTQAATTGRLVCDLVFAKPTPIDVAPYGIGRFA